MVSILMNKINCILYEQINILACNNNEAQEKSIKKELKRIT